MITKDQAINIASEYVLQITKRSKYIFLLQQERTIEFELGWVFFYQTKKFIESREMIYMAVGNSPIIIDKRTGAVHVTGTAHPIKKYIIDYYNRNL